MRGLTVFVIIGAPGSSSYSYFFWNEIRLSSPSKNGSLIASSLSISRAYTRSRNTTTSHNTDRQATCGARVSLE